VEKRSSYVYVFEGNSQTLEHQLVSPALLDVLVPDGFDIVHVNAEYADQLVTMFRWSHASIHHAASLNGPVPHYCVSGQESPGRE
jgi:predicted extracellular nuclease